MPQSLVPATVAAQCWSAELLQSWKDGTELDMDPLDPMFEARRKAVRILRKVIKETEKMSARLLGGGQGDRDGGMEGVWEAWADEKERGSMTAVECAEWLMNSEEGEKKVHVRTNTLPAYATHALMMQRPDLFLADTGEMRETGTFMVRSREERTRSVNVEGWYNGSIPGGKAIVDGFTAKAKAAMAFTASLDTNGDLAEQSHSLPDWTTEETDIISVLLTRVYEVRSTQISPTIPISQSVIKPLGVYDGAPIDQDVVRCFLVDIGILSPHDSLERSRTAESNIRHMALQGVSITGISTPMGFNDLLKGTELEELRQDFTHHKVFVIDDITASELDDGIAIENVEGSSDTWIHIHVADPTRYLHPHHAISTQASFQGSSVYTPDGNRPLLPLEIIMKELSLGAEVDKQGVMTFSALVGENGEVKDEKVGMGWIKTPRVITYAAVNDALGLSSGQPSTRPLGKLTTTTTRPRPQRAVSAPTPEDLSDLKILHDIAIKHRQRRYAFSGFEWSFPTPSLHVASNLPQVPENVFNHNSIPRSSRFFSGQPLVDYSVNPTTPSSTTLSSQSIVAECMILAGTVAASFCDKNNIPAPFRGSSAPQPINGLTGHDNSTILDTLLSSKNILGAVDAHEILKSNLYLPPGEFSTRIVPHWIMGLTQGNGYLRATSPLRRYEDMLVHWQIKSHLASTKGLSIPWSKFNEEEIGVLGKRNEIGQKLTKRASINATDWWIARTVANRLHCPLPTGYEATPDMLDFRAPMLARVSGLSTGIAVDGFASVSIRLEALACPATLAVPKGKDIPIGETINVRIDQVDTDLGMIKCVLV
jgi:exoribonuclease-2